MTKDRVTGICQECGKQFEYVLRPGFPRKYCFECGEIKKATFKAKDFQGDMEKPQQFPVERPGYVGGMSKVSTEGREKLAQKAPVKEFHLTPEKINLGALKCAIDWTSEIDLLKLMETAKEFKEFIENGN